MIFRRRRTRIEIEEHTLTVHLVTPLAAPPTSTDVQAVALPPTASEPHPSLAQGVTPIAEGAHHDR
jgi:hypothetical protein